MTKITIEQYQQLSKRTNAELETPLMDNLHMSLGMVTEAAEVADALKKHIAYGRELDLVNVKEEIGDLMFYVANICNINGWDLRDILQTNINKLAVRYPSKFTQENAVNRDLEVERKVLENG